uniref:Uncharacterized protein n=1 Tax=Clytia hemisphaerica TaxID=252671 RepID=A0A7M6DN15_9CNID
MDSSGLSSSEKTCLENWYRKRKYNFIILVILEGLFSFEYSAISISALYYFQDILKVSNPKLYYSLSMAALQFASMISSTLIGKLVDRYRNLRIVVLYISNFNVIGNLLYIFPYLNWFPILGRLLCGIADGTRPAYQGEITRTYPIEELTNLNTKIYTFAIVCHAIAPVSPIVFRWINFNLFGFEFNQYNFCSVVLIVLTIMYQLIAYFLLTDMTRDRGYQIFLRIYNKTDDSAIVLQLAETETEQSNQNNLQSSHDHETHEKLNRNQKSLHLNDDSEFVLNALESDQSSESTTKDPVRQEPRGLRRSKEEANKNPGSLLTFGQVLSNLDIDLVLFSIMLISFVYTQAEIVINIIAVNLLGWTIEHLSILTVATVLLGITFLRYLQRFNDGLDIYFLLTFCVIGNSFNMSNMMLLANYYIPSEIVKNSLVFITLCINIVPGYCAVMFSTVILTLVVPEHSRCFVMGIRQGIMKLACCFGYFVASFFYGISSEVYPSLSVLCLLTALVFLVRNKKFRNRYCVNHKFD